MKPNPVGWFEIYVADIERAKAFYETVLNTELTKLDTPDAEIELLAFPMDMQSSGASGAIVKKSDCMPSGNGTLVYFSCENCANEESRVESAGGKVQRPKMSIGQYGFITLAIDTEGNLFGLHSIK
tara:strand:- start:285268 stop:285645 length:378 start_codon:yes stop_codon:yes gene_type:complete